MNTSFQFQFPDGVSQFVNHWLGVILLLFAVACLVAGAYFTSRGIRTVHRLRQVLAIMFGRR